MKIQEIRVTLQPSGRNVFVLPGTSVLEAAGRAGIILQTPCGGKGTCGKCRVRIASGSVSAVGGPGLSSEDIREGWTLGCQARLTEPAVVEIPEESRFEIRQRILVGDSGHRIRLDPLVRKKHFRLTPPSFDDARSDLARFRADVGSLQISQDCLRNLPRFLRTNGWEGTAVVAGGRLLSIEAGDTSGKSYGIAFDVGTTTVVGTLMDLTEGKELAVASDLNDQIAYGDDVISRILKIREAPANLAKLQHAVVETMNRIIREVTSQAGVSADNVYELVVAGNSTMQEIVCGYDPSALGEVPFVQVFDDPQTISAKAVGLDVNPGAEVFVFSQIGGFVGGDTVAGILATRLDQWDQPVLLVDIGTNGEIVLAHHGRLLAASTAAGPAFEGARITQGMRATAGAIEKVIIREDVLINVIGNQAPVGLCGSALLDAAAELLNAGILDSTGRMNSGDELPAGLPPALKERVIVQAGNTAFVLASADETSSGEPVCLWQKDFRELQLATAAIRAGIHIVLRRAGMMPADVGAVLLAGAFGNYIRRSSARRIGLLPRIPCGHIRFIGNAASLGAKLALTATGERRYAADIRKKTEHVDLSRDPEFQEEFSAAMIFPEHEEDVCTDEEPSGRS